MQLTRHPNNPILEHNPNNHWEAGSVLNGTVIRVNGRLVMLYRATNGTDSHSRGQYVSSIGYAESTDGVHFIRRPEPLIIPDQPYEQGLGCEDPRVTQIGDEYFIYYTAVEGIGKDKKVRIALATTRDFKHITKHGIVGPTGTRSKAATLLSEPINKEYIWYYTWNADTPLSTIMHARFSSLDQVKQPPIGLIAQALENYDAFAVIKPTKHNTGNLIHGVERGPELGAPPIKTSYGWLLIYCPTNTKKHREWQIGAALLDLKQPWRVIAQASEPILRPETKAELTGVESHVTFPSGAIIVGSQLYVYYGSGDQGICLATMSLKELVANLRPQ